MLVTRKQIFYARDTWFVMLFACGLMGFQTRMTHADSPSDSPSQTSETDPVMQQEIANYSGSWKVISITANGETTFEEERVIVLENHTDGTWILMIDGQEKMRGMHRLSPLANPKEIDIEITSGDEQGVTLKGIYDMRDNTRRLCVRGPDGWRPQEFTGATGSECVLIEFERQKSSDF